VRTAGWPRCEPRSRRIHPAPLLPAAYRLSPSFDRIPSTAKATNPPYPLNPSFTDGQGQPGSVSLVISVYVYEWMNYSLNNYSMRNHRPKKRDVFNTSRWFRSVNKGFSANDCIDFDEHNSASPELQKRILNLPWCENHGLKSWRIFGGKFGQKLISLLFVLILSLILIKKNTRYFKFLSINK